VEEQKSDKKKKKEKVPVSWSQWKRIFALTLRRWGWVVFGMITSLIQSAAMPFTAIAFSQIIKTLYMCSELQVNNVTFYGSFKNKAMCYEEMESITTLWALGFVLSGTAMGLAAWGNSWAFRVVGESLTRLLRYNTFTGIMRRELGWFDKKENSTGILVSKLSQDAAHVQFIATIGLSQGFQTVLLAVGIVIICFVLCWEMAAFMLCLVPLMALGSQLEAKFTWLSSLNADENIAKAADIFFDAIKGIRVVCSFSLEKRFLEKWENMLKSTQSTVLKMAIIKGLANGYTRGFPMVSYSLAFLFASFILKIGRCTSNDVVMAMLIMMFSSSSIGQFAAWTPLLEKARTAIPTIFEFIDSKPEFIDVGAISNEMKSDDFQFNAYKNPSANPSTTVKGIILTRSEVEGAIEFIDVCFQYPTRPEIKVLRDISISIKPGQTVGLCGPSGSGKSTIVKLIERFYNPQGGSITLDGFELSILNVNSLRSHLGLVGQEPVLFGTTIIDNIRYAKEDATKEEVENAARQANCSKFIDALPAKYDTNVGEKGTQLSGGEKQRVAIARAIIRNPSIMLLDEATAALDSKSQLEVQSAINNVMGDRTTIIIAHRLSTIQNADNIVVMRRGKVIEQGTHQELLHLKGVYKQLCIDQKLHSQ